MSGLHPKFKTDQRLTQEILIVLQTELTRAQRTARLDHAGHDEHVVAGGGNGGPYVKFMDRTEIIDKIPSEVFDKVLEKIPARALGSFDTWLDKHFHELEDDGKICSYSEPLPQTTKAKTETKRVFYFLPVAASDVNATLRVTAVKFHEKRLERIVNQMFESVFKNVRLHGASRTLVMRLQLGIDYVIQEQRTAKSGASGGPQVILRGVAAAVHEIIGNVGWSAFIERHYDFTSVEEEGDDEDTHHGRGAELEGISLGVNAKTPTAADIRTKEVALRSPYELRADDVALLWGIRARQMVLQANSAMGDRASFTLMERELNEAMLNSIGKKSEEQKAVDASSLDAAVNSSNNGSASSVVVVVDDENGEEGNQKETKK